MLPIWGRVGYFSSSGKTTRKKAKMNCPNCGTEMHTNTIISVKPWVKYQECGNCNYNNKKEALKK